MAKKIDSDHSKIFRERIRKLMSLAGLELSGFAEYTGISESHLYSILNGNRELTIETASKIAARFKLTSEQLLRPKFNLTKKIIDEKKLTKFYEENKGIADYFLVNREETKIAYYIESHLLNSGIFDTPLSVADVRKICKESGKDLSSKRVSQILNYLVDKKKLKSKKRPVKLKSGRNGQRLVDYFYK